MAYAATKAVVADSSTAEDIIDLFHAGSSFLVAGSSCCTAHIIQDDFSTYKERPRI
eukprot:CAMPEP_0172911676 /NCGR_PEP_ID=MMETSP1075-20121228/187006_1 /TAXON_ID=2916 /ORGANISM="Ceratium fusus, Strain PA161109" /LENGTH=55 /DNA_ID=CAMNT_0013770043 /DNA_START=85 /DNA_END=249 /DNA_ORIENTATION=-